MKRIISIAILTVMLLGIMATASYAWFIPLPDDWYTDVEPVYDWFFNSVKYVTDYSLMVGTGDRTFSPRAEFSRAMLVTILWRLENSPKETSNIFTDVPKNKWYSDAVAWGYNNGIVAGMGEGRFAPNDTVTREQMAAIFMRYAEFLKIDTSARDDLSDFSDAKSIGKWALNSVKWAVADGLIYGVTKTTIDPQGKTTRAQAAAILERFCTEFLIRVPGGHNSEPATDAEVAKAQKRGTELSVYDVYDFPFLRENREVNRDILPSFDIDKTAFVRGGTTLNDLKSKTLKFFTADNVPNWSYTDSSGKTVDEWQWFDALKRELGLNVKYTVGQKDASLESALLFMNSGLQCDLIYTNNYVLPQAFCISKPVTNVINFTSGSSPGVSWSAMEYLKWGNHLNIIAPNGPSDVLWYNKTLNDSLGLVDPYTLWDDIKWDWQSFEDYMLSAPKTLKDGRELVALAGDTHSLAHAFTLTCAKPIVQSTKSFERPYVKCNLDNQKTIDALDFFANITRSVNYSASADIFDGTTLMAGNVCLKNGNAENIKLAWVPYPMKSGSVAAQQSRFIGHGMLLPKKTVMPENENIAVKFMELWATRYTEAFFDTLADYGFDAKAREKYFSFASQFYTGVSFGGALSLEKYGNLLAALAGNPDYDVKTEIANNIDIIKADTESLEHYGAA